MRTGEGGRPQPGEGLPLTPGGTPSGLRGCEPTGVCGLVSQQQENWWEGIAWICSPGRGPHLTALTGQKEGICPATEPAALRPRPGLWLAARPAGVAESWRARLEAALSSHDAPLEHQSSSDMRFAPVE